LVGKIVEALHWDKDCEMYDKKQVFTNHWYPCALSLCLTVIYLNYRGIKACLVFYRPDSVRYVRRDDRWGRGFAGVCVHQAE